MSTAVHTRVVPAPPERSPKVVLFYPNFAPYHWARIDALARLCDLTAVEISRCHQGFGWTTADSESHASNITLCNQSWETLHPAQAAYLLWRALDRIQPQVVLVPGHGTLAAFAAGAWCRLRGGRTILMSVSTSFDHPRKPWKEELKKLLLRAFFESSVAAGKRTAAYMESLGFPAQSIAVVGNVVDNEFFRSGAERLRRDTTRADHNLPSRFFLYVGRLAPEKNLTLLLDAFDRYKARGGQYSLVLVGDGPLRRQLIAHAGRLSSASAIRFDGRQDQSALLSYYAFAEAVILPSISEPWGLVINEAMACGLSAIVSDRCGCADELVDHGANGFVFAANDESALAGYLRCMEMRSPHAVRLAATRSHELVGRHSLDRWAEQICRSFRTSIPRR